MAVANSYPSAWQQGMLNCCSNCGICCYGFWCLPCLYGDNYERLHGNGCFCNCLLYYCLPGCQCLFAGPNRSSLRGKYNLPEEPCADCCVHWCCSPCAICQEAVELRYRYTAPGPAGMQFSTPNQAPGMQTMQAAPMTAGGYPAGQYPAGQYPAVKAGY